MSCKEGCEKSLLVSTTLGQILLMLFKRPKPTQALVLILCTGTALFLTLQQLLSLSETGLNINDDDRIEHKNSSFDKPAFASKRRSLPQAVVIGSRKSGTRALIKFLQVSPFVVAASREIHFFDQNYDKGLDWYRQQMPLTDASQLTIEKSPAYFVTPKVHERIKAMSPGVKIVLVLRDPVERLISDYSQLSSNRIEEFAPDDRNTDEFWKKESANFESYVLRRDGRVDDQRKSIKQGMYAMHLERWRQSFDPDNVHIVDGEALIRSPHIELQKLEIFLNVEPRIRAEDFVFVKQKGFYCLAGKKKGGKDGNKRTEGDIKEPICLSRHKGRRHVSVSLTLRDKLRQFYAPYNQYLYSLTGTNYNWTSV